MTLIQRHDGTTYDLLDYGIRTRDVLISAPTPEHEFQKVEGSHGVIDYGTTYGPRDITCLYRAQSHDITDFSLLRDEIFNIFRTEESFYLIEKRLPGKRWLVKVANPYQIPQRNVFGNFDVDFIGVKGVSESIGTTSDIDPPELIPLIQDLWEVGSYWTGDGYPNNAEGRIRLKNKHDITPSTLYKIEDSSTELFTMYVYLYKENGTYSRAVKLENGENSTRNFTTQFDEAKFTIAMWDENYTFVTDLIGKKVNVSLKKASAGGINSDNELWGFGMGLIADDDSLIYTHTDTSFKIFNAGNVTIHPFEQQLKITISNVIGSTIYLQLRNATNGSIFRITEGVASDKIIEINGANITNNGLAYLRNTNKQFIELSPGWNEFIVTGATSAKVSFDFRFYYL